VGKTDRNVGEDKRIFLSFFLVTVHGLDFFACLEQMPSFDILCPKKDMQGSILLLILAGSCASSGIYMQFLHTLMKWSHFVYLAIPSPGAVVAALTSHFLSDPGDAAARSNNCAVLSMFVPAPNPSIHSCGIVRHCLARQERRADCCIRVCPSVRALVTASLRRKHAAAVRISVLKDQG